MEEARKVRAKMKEYGLDKGDIEVYVMAEIPANILRAEEFSEMFEGFSVGTNDLTQLTLGVDRNSDKLKHVFDERDEAVKKSVRTLINKAHRKDRHVGICGDAPSTHDEYAEFLVDAGIDAISVSPDVALETIMKVAEIEENQDERSSVEVEVDVEADIGSTAGQIYDTLNQQGTATANKILETASGVNSNKLNQALGWLAKEGKIEVEEDDDGKKYSLR